MRSVNEIFKGITGREPPVLTPEWIAGANRRLLAGLEEHLEEGVVPGKIPAHPVEASRYRGAPRRDCAFLLDRLCRWLEGDDWPVRPDRHEDRIASAILRAVFVHLYIAWIHPFGDGNGRTARLAEFMILAGEGVPSPCAHLTGIQLKLAWEHFVYREFQRIPPSPAMRRRREVTLALGRVSIPVGKKAVPDLSPDLARLYAAKTSKTLSRDMNWLVKRDLLEREGDGYRARVETMRAFQPVRAWSMP